MTRHLRLLAPALLAALLAACASVPETGRSQLMLVTPAQEADMGGEQFERLKQSEPISDDPATNALVQRVGERIAAVAPLPNARWEFVAFDRPDTANAFCLPAGKVGVYTGILDITRSEAGLATVVGHEVAHAVARHGAERLSEALLVQLGGKLLDQAMAENGTETRALINSAYGLGTTVGVMLPHSRAHELEADRLGQLYMARAGYDPREAIAFWERFEAAKSGQGAPPVFLSTHPPDAQRIRALKRHLPEAMAEYRAATGG